MEQADILALIGSIRESKLPNSITPSILANALEAIYLSKESGETPISLQEVVEWPTYADRPAVGAANTIYIDLSTDDMYYWNGSDYAPLNASSTTITIRSLNDLNSYQSPGVYACLYIQTDVVRLPPRTVVTSYTLRIESSSATIMQFLENREGYRWRTYRNGAWGDWENVTFATTAYVDEALSGIENLLASI